MFEESIKRDVIKTLLLSQRYWFSVGDVITFSGGFYRESVVKNALDKLVDENKIQRKTEQRKNYRRKYVVDVYRIGTETENKIIDYLAENKNALVDEISTALDMQRDTVQETLDNLVKYKRLKRISKNTERGKIYVFRVPRS